MGVRGAGWQEHAVQGLRATGGQTGSYLLPRACYFWTRSRLSHASSSASQGHGHQRTRGCWWWRISLIKDSINILQPSGKGLVARWPAIWWASTPGFVRFCGLEFNHAYSRKTHSQGDTPMKKATVRGIKTVGGKWQNKRRCCCPHDHSERGNLSKCDDTKT